MANNKFCPNINHPDAKALIEKLGLLGFYKEYIKNGYQLPSVDEDIFDNTTSVADLLFINKDKFNAHQQSETIKSIIFQIQQLRKEGLSNAKEIISQIKSDFTETEAYWRNPTDFPGDEVTTQIADNIKNVLDNFDQFVIRANRELEKTGLKTTGVSVVTENTSIQTDNTTQESNYDTTDGIFQKLNYSDDSSFSQSSKDTASGDIKTALSLIPKYVYEKGKLSIDDEGNPEAELNHLYLPKFEDIDSIWKDMLYTLIDVPIGSKLDYLKNSSNPRHQVIYNEIVTNPKTNIQNEFEVVFSKQQANFVTVNISKPDASNNKTIAVFDTNRSNANSFIVDNWYESFLQSGIIKTDNTGNRYIYSKLGEIAKAAFLSNKELLKTNPTLAISNITGLLNKLGLNISEKAFNESVRDETGKVITGAEVINTKLSYLFDRLAGSIQEQDLEDSLEYNNPFINDTSSITLLAKLENKANPTLFEDSFISGDGKSKYSFVNNSYLSLKMRKLKTDTNYLLALKKTPYASQSFWLNQLLTNPTFANNFGVFYTDTLGNDKTNQVNKPFRRMSTKEKEFTRVAMFQNQGRGTDAKSSNIGYFVGLIPSDKTTIPIFKTLKVDVKVDEQLRFNNDTIDVIYDQFISEYNRVKQTQAQNNDDSIQKIDSYHGKNSAGNKFIVFRFLNKDLIVNNELLELDDIRLAEIVRPKIEQFLADLTKDQITYWQSLDLYNDGIYDKSYKAKKGYKDEAGIRSLAADYAVNQFVFMMNQTQLISGDPALHGKNDKTGAVSIDKTWVNFYKRMAKDIAPGLDGNFKNSSYNTIFLQDLKYDTALLNEYNDKVGDIAQAYVGLNPADAQEYTTLQEHLDVMEAYGRLTEEAKAAGQRLLNGGSDISDISLILQPMKPVYVNDKIEDNINKYYYIKTSSFPLIPALTSGLEIDKLRVAMEAKDVQRAVYVSGVKLGVQGTISQMSKDGFIKFKELDLASDQIINLDRSGFRIQQELPYHGGDTHISEGSQARKLILNNVEDTDTIRYNGKDISGKEAKQLFEDLHIEKMNRAYDQFMTDIGFDKTLNKITDLSKIEKILKEEATLRDYPINDIYSIQVITENGQKRFKVPLGFNNNSSRFESILNALVTNRVIKQELPGFSKVQGSGAGFSKIAGFDEANSVIKSSIVWMDKNDTVLSYTKSSDGTLTGADILVPSWFKDTDMSTYINSDGVLDTERMPKELLTLMGIRIPTQGYNSMMKFIVKGFLPKYVGDLAIVPSEIVIQMGSDFDVDKLFLYRYNYNKDSDGKFSRNELDTSDLSKLSNAQLEDGIMQMFVDRMSDEKLLDQMLEPNGFGVLPEVANTVAKLQTGDKSIHTFTTKDQNSIHKLNNDGKAGTGIFSLFSTFNKAAQDAKLSLKQPLKFKNNSGQVVPVSNLYEIRGIENQRKSSVIAYLQSAAVDNSKEQILGKLNINDTTMGVAGTLAVLGLDESFVGYFLAQPVLVDYVARIQQSNDIISAEFDPTLETKTKEDLYKQLLGQDYTLDLVNTISDKVIYGSKELLQFLQQDDNSNEAITQLSTEELDTVAKANNMFAAKVLTDFIAIKGLADNIRVIQSATNVDTGGLGASFTALETKSQQINNLLEQSAKESYPINNIQNIFSNNVIGKASTVLNQTKSIYSQILPQGSIAYQQAIEKIQKSVGLLMNDANLNDIYRNIKSYILTSPDILTENIEDLRQNLLYSKDNIAKRWLDYSNSPEGKRNILTNRIKPRFAKTKGDPNTLTSLNTPASNNSVDIDNSIMYFYDMIENGTQVEKVLANDLVKYYIVTGAQFGPSSIGKYISYDVLEKTNFSEKLRHIEDDMNKGYILDGFIDQYFQNNPSKAKSYQLENAKDTFVTREIPELTIEGSGMAGYFNYYDQKASKFVLYKKIDKTPAGFVYSKLDIKANTKQQIKNYNFSQSTASSIEDKVVASIPTRTAREVVTADTIKEDYNFNGGAEGILKAIINKSDNAYYSNIASDLLSKLGNNLSSVKVQSSTARPVNGTYNGASNTVSINFDVILGNYGDQSGAKFEEVVLHELLHAGTVNSINKFTSLQGTKSNPQMVTDGDFTREQILAINGINNLFEQYRNSYSDQGKLAKFTEINSRRANDPKSISAEELQFLKDNKSELYPLYNVKEFIAAGLTSPEFTNTLKANNLWTKIVDFISNLLGVNKSDLDALYNSTISLLDNNATNAVSAEAKGIRNYSGAAKGSDTQWENIGKEYGIETTNYTTSTMDKLSSSQIAEVEAAYIKAAKDLGRGTLAADSYSGKLVRRDYLQAKAADQVFAIGNIVNPGETNKKGYLVKAKHQSVDGGTGYATQMAINLGKEVNVFNQLDNKWYTAQYNDNLLGEKVFDRFVQIATPTINGKYAGIGTREISEQGVQAIRDVYAKTFNISEDFNTTQDEVNRLTFVEQRNSFLKAYKKQIGSVLTPESLENIKKYADANTKYSNLKIWGWPRGDGKLELRVSRVDPVYDDIADNAPKSESQIFIDRVLSKFKDNLQTLQDRQRTLGDKAPADLSVRIDNLRKQIADLTEKQSVIATIDAADNKVKEIRKALDNNTATTTDLYEFKSYINMLVNLNQQIEFSEDFNDLSVRLNNISAEAVKLNTKLRGKEIETVQAWLTEQLDIPFDLKAKLDKGLKDVGYLEGEFLDFGKSSSEVIQSIGNLIDKAKFEANQKHDEFADQLTPLLKDYLSKYKTYDMLLQKDTEGKPTGFLLNKYSQEFYTKSKGNFKFFNSNTTVDYIEDGRRSYEEDKTIAFENMSEEDYFSWLRLNSPEVFMEDWKNGRRTEAKGAEKYLSIKPSDKWVDSKYNELKALGEEDPAVKFYNFIEPIIRKTSRKYNQQSNYIPEIQKTTLDYFMSGNMKGGFSNMNRALVDSLTVQLNNSSNQIDEFTGELRPSIPVAMFANNLSAEDKSYDLARIVEAIQYQEFSLTAKREIEPLLNIYYNVLQDTKSISTKPNGDEIVIDKAPVRTLDQSNYLIQSYLYDKSKDVEGVSDQKINGKNIAASKVTDTLINYVRLKGMALNPFSAIGNVMQAITSNFITASGGEFFNMSDYFKAFSTMLYSIGGTGDNAKKISKLLRKFDAFSKANELQFGTSREIKDTQNALNNLSWFELQQRGEYFNQGHTLIAMLYNKKIEVDGKSISLYEGYDSDGKWKAEYGEDPFADKTELYKFQQLVKTALIDVHGNYTREIKAKKHFYTRAIMVFRTWIPQAVNTRFGGESTDILTGRSTKGRYRSYNSFIRNNDGKIDLDAIKENVAWLLGAKNNTMTELDKINMRKNIAELALIGAITILILGLKAALDDLDDDEKNYTTYVLNSLSRSQSDLTFFMLPSSFQTITKDPIPLMGVLDDQIDLLKAGFSTITGDPVYKTGSRKGKSRLYKELADNFPVLNQIDKNLNYAAQVF